MEYFLERIMIAVISPRAHCSADDNIILFSLFWAWIAYAGTYFSHRPLSSQVSMKQVASATWKKNLHFINRMRGAGTGGQEETWIRGRNKIATHGKFPTDCFSHRQQMENLAQKVVFWRDILVFFSAVTYCYHINRLFESYPYLFTEINYNEMLWLAPI